VPRNRLFEAVAALAYLVMFTWISVSGVTLGSRQLLPAGPLTALAVLGGGTLAVFLLLGIGKRRS
jgi:hypothetical protein